MTKTVHNLKQLIVERLKHCSASKVWTPADFLDLGSRDAVDKVLQRMVNSRDLRRIERGLYDQPRINFLTGQSEVLDYRKIIEAIARRDQVRILLDGMTCANDLGLTNTVPGQVIIHTDSRLCNIKLENLIIRFKVTAPSKLYWADRPGMRVVQALYWLHNELKNRDDLNLNIIMIKLVQLLQTSDRENKIRNDLHEGINTLPAWMQKWVRELLIRAK